MKEYVAPVMTCVELRVEESVSTVGCYVGSCDSNGDGILEYVSPSGS